MKACVVTLTANRQARSWRRLGTTPKPQSFRGRTAGFLVILVIANCRCRAFGSFRHASTLAVGVAPGFLRRTPDLIFTRIGHNDRRALHHDPAARRSS